MFCTRHVTGRFQKNSHYLVIWPDDEPNQDIEEMTAQIQIGFARLYPLSLILEIPLGRERDIFYNDIRIACLQNEITHDRDAAFSTFTLMCNNLRGYIFCIKQFRQHMHPLDPIFDFKDCELFHFAMSIRKIFNKQLSRSEFIIEVNYDVDFTDLFSYVAIYNQKISEMAFNR